jgi:NAD(P)-dependent dehydrogenase (short-subunit alcohol dehydrogenase family)
LRQLRAFGVKVLYQETDVADRCRVDAALDKVWQELGPLDVCLCNAGIVVDRPFLDVTVAEWQRHIDVNLTGYFQVCQAVARRWVAAKHRGRMVFTGSWLQDVPYKLVAPYCVSKAGVWMLARCAALELAQHGITVNLVAPGILDAGLSRQEMEEDPASREKYMKLIPLGKMQTPEDTADMVGFLISPEAGYLTGTSLLCDGGCTVSAASTAGGL